MAKTPSKPIRQSQPRYAALYIRVSTRRQGDDGDSLQHQEKTLRKKACADGHRRVVVFQDVASGKDDQRAEWLRLIEQIKTGSVAAVYVTKLDRAMRSVSHFLQSQEVMREHGTAFICPSFPFTETKGAFAKVFSTMLAALAEFERELIRERVVAVMDHRAEEGMWNGGVVPFGYTSWGRCHKESLESGKTEPQAVGHADKHCKDQKQLYLDRSEAADLRALMLRYDANPNLNQLRAWAESKGIKTRKGTKWSPTSLRRVMTNPVIVGQIEYGKRRTNEKGKLKKAEPRLSKGKQEGIAPRDLFERVAAKLAANAGKRRRHKTEYLLSGIVSCACGGAMHGRTQVKEGNGKVYSYYRCRWCGTTVPARLNEIVLQKLCEVGKDDHYLKDRERVARNLEAATQQDKDHSVQQIRKLRKHYAVLKEEISSLTSKLVHVDSESAIRAIEQQIEQRQLALDGEEEAMAALSSNGCGSTLVKKVRQEVDAVVRFADRIKGAEPELLRNYIRAMVPRICVDVPNNAIEITLQSDSLVGEIERMDTDSSPPPTWSSPGIGSWRTTGRW